jgi:hypothetical protein
MLRVFLKVSVVQSAMLMLDPKITPCIKPFKDCNACCLAGGKASKCVTGFPGV